MRHLLTLAVILLATASHAGTITLYDATYTPIGLPPTGQPQPREFFYRFDAGESWKKVQHRQIVLNDGQGVSVVDKSRIVPSFFDGSPTWYYFNLTGGTYTLGNIAEDWKMHTLLNVVVTATDGSVVASGRPSTANIPEPSTLALLSLSGIFIIRRKS